MPRNMARCLCPAGASKCNGARSAQKMADHACRLSGSSKADQMSSSPSNTALEPNRLKEALHPTLPARRSSSSTRKAYAPKSRPLWRRQRSTFGWIPEKVCQLRPAFTAASFFLEFARLSSASSCCWLNCKKARWGAALVVRCGSSVGGSEMWASRGDAQANVLHFVMIKPSHYDEDGYPIQWARSAIPSNTLACLNALAEDARRREVVGPNVEIRLHTFDQTNRRVRPDRIIRMIRKLGGSALIGLVGVQSNQFPRSVDLARPFLAAGLPVCIGGFHVSGCIAMLPELPADIAVAQTMGISFFAGECEEGRLDEVLQDAWNGKLKPLYNYMDKLPTLTGEPPPFLPRKHVRRTSGSLSSIALGGVCPYQCSFCTIINVQGRKSRFRTPDDLEKIVRENHAQGIRRFFITYDNFARNRDWELVFDRLIHLRKTEFPGLGFTIQVDTLCHKIPNFIEKA